MLGLLTNIFGHSGGQFVPPLDPEKRAFIGQMHANAAPFIGRRTVVLYGVNCLRWPCILGSGVPLNLGGRKFVGTAAHVLDRVLADKSGLYLSPGVQGGQLIDLDGCATHRTKLPASNDRRDDPFDIALIALSDTVVEAIGSEILFVEVNEIDFDDPEQFGAYYFLHGFPRSRSRVNPWKRTVRCKSLPYGSILYAGERGVWNAAHEDIYVDLDFDRTKTVDDFGRRVRTPGPKGVSGCGIWRLCKAGVRPSEWSVDEVRLVAIEHRWESELQVLRGTKICYLNQIIAHNYPDCFLMAQSQWRELQGRGRRASSPAAS
jgi:hypothetical protein